MVSMEPNPRPNPSSRRATHPCPRFQGSALEGARKLTACHHEAFLSTHCQYTANIASHLKICFTTFWTGAIFYQSSSFCSFYQYALITLIIRLLDNKCLAIMVMAMEILTIVVWIKRKHTLLCLALYLIVLKAGEINLSSWQLWLVLKGKSPPVPISPLIQ